MVVGKLLKKWDMVIDEAENCLQLNPKNISVLYALGEAAKEAKYIDTSISVLESILSFDKSHVKSLKTLGAIYINDKEDLEKARVYYQKASRLAPQDAEASKSAKDLAARITANQYGKAKSSKDLIKDRDKAQDLEADQAILRTEDDFKRAIERTKKKLETNPESKKDLRKLGDLYQKLGELDKAVHVYEKILSLDPTSFDIKCKISDCNILKVDKKVKKLQGSLKKQPNNPNIKQELQKTLKQKLEVEIKEYSIQIKDQPTNNDIRFKLGYALFNANRFDDAITQFQYSVKDPRKKVHSATYMGQAFLRKKDFELAITQFNNALKALSAKDREYKKVQYYLAMAYETSNDTEKAIEIYTSIYKEDINFKDVQARLKKLRG